MFYHDPHFTVWNDLQRHLKRGEYTAVAEKWQASLPGLAAHLDELRMLYYIGRFGEHAPYTQACSTLGYLRDSMWEMVQYRLSIFRYAVDTNITNPGIRQWMIADLATVLGVTPADFPPQKLSMPNALKDELKKINPSLGDEYSY